jgi:uncharacterized protein
MKIIKRFALIAFPVLVGAYAPFPTSAQSPPATLRPQAAVASPSSEALQAAKELLSVIGDGSNISAQAAARSWPFVEQSLRAGNSKLDQGTLAEMRREFERRQAIFVEKFAKELPAIYAHYYTAEEMRELIAFYRTPIGMKMRAIASRVDGDIAALASSDLPAMDSQLVQSFNAILRQHGYLR